MSKVGFWADLTRGRSVADFEIKVIEEGWLLTPTTRAARLWCKSHLTAEAHKAGDGYMLEEQHLLKVIEQFMDRKTGWFRY